MTLVALQPMKQIAPMMKKQRVMKVSKSMVVSPFRYDFW
jgi:hypothetical protein